MAKNLELVKFGVDFIKAWQIWFFGARLCGLYFFFGAWLRCGGRAGRIWFVCAVRLKSRAIWLVAVGGAKSVVRVKIWERVAFK